MAVEITNNIGPTGTNGGSPAQFPTHLDYFGFGGYRSVADQSERLGIFGTLTEPRRQLGMAVYQVDTQKLYILTTNPATPLTVVGDWTEFSGGGSAVDWQTVMDVGSTAYGVSTHVALSTALERNISMQAGGNTIIKLKGQDSSDGCIDIGGNGMGNPSIGDFLVARAVLSTGVWDYAEVEWSGNNPGGGINVGGPIKDVYGIEGPVGISMDMKSTSAGIDIDADDGVSITAAGVDGIKLKGSIGIPAIGATVVAADVDGTLGWGVAGGNGIYSGSGSLSGATTITMGANDLEFSMTTGDIIFNNNVAASNPAFFIDGSTSTVGMGGNASLLDQCSIYNVTGSGNTTALGIVGNSSFSDQKGIDISMSGGAFLNTGLQVDVSGGTINNHAIVTTGGNSGFGTASPDDSALVEVKSTTQGFLPPVMTTAERDAIPTPATGLIVYSTTLNKLCVYTGAGWEQIDSA